jgi:hypothetical protein
MYFVFQRNYETLSVQAHALTHTCYLYMLHILISRPIVYKEGLGCLSLRVPSHRGLPLSLVCLFTTTYEAQSYFASVVHWIAWWRDIQKKFSWQFTVCCNSCLAIYPCNIMLLVYRIISLIAGFVTYKSARGNTHTIEHSSCQFMRHMPLNIIWLIF